MSCHQEIVDCIAAIFYKKYDALDLQGLMYFHNERFLRWQTSPENPKYIKMKERMIVDLNPVTFPDIWE